MIAIVWLGKLLVMHRQYMCEYSIPVDVDVEASAKIMCNSINGNVKYDGCENSISAD